MVGLIKRFSAASGDAEATRAEFETEPTDEVKLSALKKRFYTTLARHSASSTETRSRASGSPRIRSAFVRSTACWAWSRSSWRESLVFGLGSTLGAGLIGLGLVVPAVALLAVASRMPRKTRTGAELHRRTLGFRHYMEIAEKERQRFAERENIFSEYLPYAIVFGCVEKWANAFKDIDATAGDVQLVHRQLARRVLSE